MDKKGFTLVELIVTVSIIAILAAIAIPAYVGQQKRATRSEAYSNLSALRLLEEQYYAENGAYTVSLGTCAKDRPGNITLIQAAGALPGFKPGSSLTFSYCVLNGVAGEAEAAKSPCFKAKAYGNTSTRVDGDVFWIDCDNNKNF